ncbi:hypothetical protein FN846DRAFT_981340 [Sphaerosporella brunnea]|uniref:RING-type domain-containing protein n=1 Tax=Sphaerosporella brunnea TaxID=1250544 RepID=A0A5J5ECB7_9PEZI|nr:hypothetical protein FN846DRAFT_981340 [Sphaerosporella brunnea]
MTSLSSAAAAIAPPSASAGIITPANPAHGFRSATPIMASVPRFFAKLASLGYIGTGSVAAATSSVPAEEVIANTTTEAAVVESSVAAAANATVAAAAAAEAAGAFDGGLRSMGSVFTYVTSKWAVLCLFMTVLLNRTQIYATLRRPIRLPFKTRMIMRGIPIAMLAYQLSHMMFAMRCQTSLAFQGDGARDGADAFFYSVAKVGSFWLDDRAVCEAIGMIPDAHWIDQASSVKDTENPEIEIPRPRGSLEILWPLYKALSLSQFVEVFTCSLVGRVPQPETGMTLLEHSLAFAEAEALALRKTYRLETNHSSEAGPSEEAGDGPEHRREGEITVFKIKGEKLVPAEVLYIAMISTMSHLTSHIMAIFNIQTRYRLLTTGFYGMAFFAGFAVALYHNGATGILEFPTVSVVGFIPHLLILGSIAICGGIYGLALLLASLFPPSGRRSFSEGFNNLRANLTLSSTAAVRLNEDFYTVLLKLGYSCLTAAAEATYLNEGRAVRIPAWTWLESERAKLLEARRGGAGRNTFAPTGKGMGPFSMERKDFSGVVQSAKEKRRAATRRWIGAGELARGVVAMVGRWAVAVSSKIFGRRTRDEDVTTPAPPDDRTLDFWDEHLDEDYAPSETGSVSSSSSFSSEEEEENADEAQQDGAEDYDRGRREETPLLDPIRLAALLDPQSPEDRASARLLARHLVSSTPLTRRQYSATQLSGLAEEVALENILLSRRRPRRPQHDREEEDMDKGPVCVVCQSESRTVIVWPCRCLSLCEDCRVCLAMNNWSSCVTCRGACAGYSRVYVP